MNVWVGAIIVVYADYCQAAPPPLPVGLEEAAPTTVSTSTASAQGLGFSGFWELRGGLRTQNDPAQSATSLAETRLGLGWEGTLHNNLRVDLKADVLYDAEAQDQHVDLDRGAGWLDLRQANIAFSPSTFIDVKVGRQILTWGVGDLLFINDLFPKDFPSFFLGRDEAYLKAPSDALKVSFFSNLVNLDIVYVPRFDVDRFITGERLSITSSSGQFAPTEAVDVSDGDEWALRLYRTMGATELALYAYDGFWKSPAGVNSTTAAATFPRLRVFGGSLRRSLFGGIGALEIGYYDSPQAAQDNQVRASELRWLIGYERELARNVSLGLQYYVETARDGDDRHLLTTRLSWHNQQQTLRGSLFAFYSPADDDAYLRPQLRYQYDDHWSGELGGNFFLGSQASGFFAGLKNNSNIYAAVRYGF